MTAKTWLLMGFCIFTLFLQFAFIYIVLKFSNRFVHTVDKIDPIDDHIKEMNRDKTHIE